MTHREAIKEWLGKIKYCDAVIYDWGSGSKPVSRYIEHKNCTFTTIDKNKLIAQERRAAIHITHNIEDPIDLPEADAAFCVEVLEHTLYPHGVLLNIYNGLKSGSRLYLTMPYNFRVHSDDDYMRLTENGLVAYLEANGFKIQSIQETEGNEGFIVEAIK